MSTSTRSQDDLKVLMQEEIAGHIWEFDSEIVAKMLSPKLFTPNLPDRPFISDFQCRISHLDPAILGCASQKLSEILGRHPNLWPTTTTESAAYVPIATFLNACLQACRDALALDYESYYDNLWFSAYDRETADGIGGASPLKPDVVGIKGSRPGNRVRPKEHLWWKPPMNQLLLQLLLPCEVKGRWKDLIMQAATYARALFFAAPSRIFALTLAFNHKTMQLRFLIFHRGGLTASKPLCPSQPEHFGRILQLFLSIMLWQTPTDAGFLGSCNELVYAIPSSLNNTATVQEVLHNSDCVRGRATRVSRVSTRTGTVDKPETALLAQTKSTLVLSEQRSVRPESSPTGTPSTATHSSGGTMSSVRESVTPLASLTPEKTLQESSVRLYGPTFEGAVSYTAPPKHHQRFSTLRIPSTGYANLVLKVAWQQTQRMWNEANAFDASANCFGTPHYICSYIVYDHLGHPVTTSIFLPTPSEAAAARWSLYDKQPPVPEPEYRYCMITLCALEGQSLVTARSSLELRDALAHGILGWLGLLRAGYLHRDISIGNVLLLKWPTVMPPFTIQPIGAEETQNVDKVRDAVNKLGVRDKGRGFVTDGDLCSKLEDHFSVERRSSTISGTLEFLSRKAYTAVTAKKPHTQSPMDDLWSFFWVAIWSVVFNKHLEQQRATEETELQSRFKTPESRETIMDILDVYSSIQREWTPTPLLRDWEPILYDWYKKLVSLQDDFTRAFFDPRVYNADRSRIISVFQEYALKGVADVMEIFDKHKDAVTSEPF
ncbi:hypothetical protein EIP91_007624 [Steccherinum ochraceum]|uniref:Fungal-type protein kinase domain-containing protein n=1 Tax=Steccherinum ochraceum TaxID=92696 RepID=A0A4R0R6E4_9APHY|nr:hypothetical protein EIP91_007624 [Steccherinum ochraceum]